MIDALGIRKFTINYNIMYVFFVKFNKLKFIHEAFLFLFISKCLRSAKFDQSETRRLLRPLCRLAADQTEKFRLPDSAQGFRHFPAGKTEPSETVGCFENCWTFKWPLKIRLEIFLEYNFILLVNCTEILSICLLDKFFVLFFVWRRILLFPCCCMQSIYFYTFFIPPTIMCSFYLPTTVF